jgi:hypothetical protein
MEGALSRSKVAGTMGHFDFRSFLSCPLSTVFSVYTDTDAWCRCTNVKKVQWLGKPWVQGARMRVTSEAMITQTMDQVLLRYEPERRLTYLSHFFGVTLETRLSFRAISDFETEIHVRAEFVGVASRTFGFALGPAIEQGTRAFIENLNKECERIASTGEQPHRNKDGTWKKRPPDIHDPM